MNLAPTRIHKQNKLFALTLAIEIADRHIVRFNTQNALYILAENLKYPEFAHNRAYSISHKKALYYMPVNYTPSINWLMENGILIRGKAEGNWNSRVTYTVKKTKLTQFINHHLYA